MQFQVGASAPVTNPPLTSTSSHPKMEDLRAQYPNIQYWKRRDYLTFLKNKKPVLDPTQQPPQRGGRRLAETGENVATDYIEREDGTIADGDVAKNIREYLRSIFNEVNKSPNMELPTQWSDATIIVRKYIYDQLYAKYPYIRICEEDWKATYLVSRALTSFQSTLRRRQGKTTVKVEQELTITADTEASSFLADNIISPAKSSKRKATGSEIDRIPLPSPKRLRSQSPPESSEPPTGTPILTSPTARSMSTSLTLSTPIVTSVGDLDTFASPGPDPSTTYRNPRLVRRAPPTALSPTKKGITPPLGPVRTGPNPNLRRRVGVNLNMQASSQAPPLEPSTLLSPLRSNAAVIDNNLINDASGSVVTFNEIPLVPVDLTPSNSNDLLHPTSEVSPLRSSPKPQPSLKNPL